MRLGSPNWSWEGEGQLTEWGDQGRPGRGESCARVHALITDMGLGRVAQGYTASPVVGGFDRRGNPPDQSPKGQEMKERLHPTPRGRSAVRILAGR